MASSLNELPEKVRATVGKRREWTNIQAIMSQLQPAKSHQGAEPNQNITTGKQPVIGREHWKVFSMRMERDMMCGPGSRGIMCSIQIFASPSTEGKKE